MPHFVIEHFSAPEDGFAVDHAMRIALETGAHCGFIQREDIKVRTLPAQAILFGDGRTSFIHVTVSLLAGRTEEKKLALATALVGALRDAFPRIRAISADIRDMDPACYRKSLA